MRAAGDGRPRRPFEGELRQSREVEAAALLPEEVDDAVEGKLLGDCVQPGHRESRQRPHGEGDAGGAPALEGDLAAPLLGPPDHRSPRAVEGQQLLVAELHRGGAHVQRGEAVPRRGLAGGAGSAGLALPVEVVLRVLGDVGPREKLGVLPRPGHRRQHRLGLAEWRGDPCGRVPENLMALPHGGGHHFCEDQVGVVEVEHQRGELGLHLGTDKAPPRDRAAPFIVNKILVAGHELRRLRGPELEQAPTCRSGLPAGPLSAAVPGLCLGGAGRISPAAGVERLQPEHAGLHLPRSTALLRVALPPQLVHGVLLQHNRRGCVGALAKAVALAAMRAALSGPAFR
mmetsp:Transcript_15229/g.36219  ORF Transcript_15229/g.36219 Transcript_15229/m.36219 type:complete len:343 (-) Transcript_15229:834-1862(-)